VKAATSRTLLGLCKPDVNRPIVARLFAELQTSNAGDTHARQFIGEWLTGFLINAVNKFIVHKAIDSLHHSPLLHYCGEWTVNFFTVLVSDCSTMWGSFTATVKAVHRLGCLWVYMHR